MFRKKTFVTMTFLSVVLTIFSTAPANATSPETPTGEPGEVGFPPSSPVLSRAGFEGSDVVEVTTYTDSAGTEHSIEVQLHGDPVIAYAGPVGEFQTTSSCGTNTTSLRSATLTHRAGGVNIYRNYLDISFRHNNCGVSRISITGATGQALLWGVSFNNVSAKTTQINGNGSRARAKAQFNYTAGMSWLGSSLNSCLGINVVRSAAALSVNTDSSCRTNP